MTNKINGIDESEEIIIDGVDVAGCEYMLNNKIKGKQHCPAKAMPYAKETSCICRKSIDTPYNFCKHNPNCYYKQLKRLQETLKHTENGRKEKANKLKRIEEIVTHCIQGGFTDEFVQEIFDICREYEEV